MKKRQKWDEIYAPTWRKTKKLVVDYFFNRKSIFDEKETEKTYTLTEIKDAFWTTFHEGGCIQFEWIDSPERNAKITEIHWKRFVRNLSRKGD